MEQLYEILDRLFPGEGFRSSQDYLGDKLLDSFGIAALVTELDQEYHIQIDLADILPENFENAQAIMRLIDNNGGLS